MRAGPAATEFTASAAASASSEHDDAGQHITVDGFHRRLTNDLDLRWKGRTAPLDCDMAFAYDLDVTKEPATD